MKKKIPKEALEKILRRNTWVSTGVGLIPVPAADFAGLMAIQLNMLKEIADIYEVPFLKEAAKKVVFSLLGGLVLNNATPFLASMAKFIPGVGQILGAAGMPIACGASTYAAGKVFIRHFESGGTFQTFDTARMKAYYAEMLKEGKSVATKAKKDDPAAIRDNPRRNSRRTPKET